MARSYSLVDGFISAFDTWNPVVAAPVLRMQLDSLVRVSYVARAPKADEVAIHVVTGGEFRKLKDTDGKLLSDARLNEHAKPHHPWVAPVYAATSGWVHLSPEHVRAAWRLDPEEDEDAKTFGISGGVPVPREFIPVSAFQELLGAMTQATEELFGYVEVWEARKGLPSGEMRSL